MAKYSDLFDLAERNSAYMPLYVAAIDACENEVDEKVAKDAIEAARCESFQIQPASSILDTLVRRGAIVQKVYADGEPYDGTLKDAQEDDELPVEAVITVSYESTDEGLTFAKAESSDKRVAKLFAENPNEAEGFKTVLSATLETGKTTSEIQKILKEKNLIEQDERGIDLVHASYFTGALQNAGALAWNKGTWVATDEGKRVVA